MAELKASGVIRERVEHQELSSIFFEARRMVGEASVDTQNRPLIDTSKPAIN